MPFNVSTVAAKYEPAAWLYMNDTAIRPASFVAVHIQPAFPTGLMTVGAVHVAPPSPEDVSSAFVIQPV